MLDWEGRRLIRRRRCCAGTTRRATLGFVALRDGRRKAARKAFARALDRCSSYRHGRD